MNNPVITYFPFSAYTVPVYPVYNDQTILVTSDTSSRYSYKLLSDVYINGQDVATMKSYPFNGIIEVNPQNITMNYLLHDFNYSASPICDNYDSVKSVYTVLGEEFSRVISFSGIGNFFGYAAFALTMPTLLQSYDMVQVTVGNQTVYGEISEIYDSTLLITNIPYSYLTSYSCGTAIEATQYYDYTGGVFSTVNPHNFNVGDTVILQMNTWSNGTILATGGSSGSITQVSVGGQNLLTSSVPFNTNLATTMSDLALAISANYSNTGGYSAYNETGSELIHIYSSMFTEEQTVGLPIIITHTGNLTFSFTPTMTNLSGYDINGEGWNPQLSGEYTISTVLSPTTFTVSEDIPVYYNNITGSERGIWYSMNNYVFTGLTTGGTYYVMNNGNYYCYPNYSSEVALHTFKELPFTTSAGGEFLTNKPNSAFEFYSNNDIETVDILFPVGGSVGSNQTMILNTYTGVTNNFSNAYTIDIYSYLNQFSGSYWTRFSLGVGAYNLNEIPAQYVSPSANTGNLINNNVNSYTIQLQETDFLTFSYSKKLTFTRQCNNYTYYQLIFLNKWGAYDYLPLNANYEQDLSVERTQFERKRESVFSPYSYGVNVPDRGKTDFYINSAMNIKLLTDWLTLDESNWLMEVFESPQVYLYCPNDNTTGIDFTNLYPVNIVDTEIKLFNQRSRMKQFQITCTVSNRRINQKN